MSRTIAATREEERRGEERRGEQVSWSRR